MDDAFENEAFPEARQLALEYLDLAQSNTSDWNYGNAIHHANLLLGRIALRNGQREMAKTHLIAAGETPGSPQLNTFGPNMALAKELLEKGEYGIVLKYLQLCEMFWGKMFSEPKIKAWEDIIKNGKIPDFAAHLAY